MTAPEPSSGPVELSVVVPVYGSEDTLKPLYERIAQTLQNRGTSYEVVFVDDDSRDGSWSVLQALKARHPGSIVLVRLTRNFGQHNALMCGFHHAQGRLILTMDDDLQNPPEEIPKLLDALERGDHDVIYGTPRRSRQNGLRRGGSALVRWFYRKVFRSAVDISSFRLISAEIMPGILRYDLNFTFLDGLLAWHTQRIGSVAVDHMPRAQGSSRYSVAKLVTLALNLFTNFSLGPLQAISIMGMISACLGIAGGLYFLVMRLAGGIAVPGYASIIVASLILGGLQLLSLGVIGEYIGRIHMNLNRKPQFAVRSVEGREAGAESGPPEAPSGPTA
ncbi:MAG: glycosyltransferase [Armatimonadia bacterium]|nr:glycosyltransferase [Armatimonadia bacterium]